MGLKPTDRELLLCGQKRSYDVSRLQFKVGVGNRPQSHLVAAIWSTLTCRIGIDSRGKYGLGATGNDR